MTWTQIYLACFLLGFSLSAVSWLLGVIGLHPPHVHAHGVNVRVHHAHVGHAHGVHGAHADAGPGFFNFSTATAFLAWFGGAGYLLSRYSGVWPLAGLLLPVIVGVVSTPIRAGGTGEILFTLAGGRRVSGARSDDGRAIEKGIEVVNTR